MKPFVARNILLIRTLSTLRPYQKECIQISLDKIENGVKNIAISLPVGSGKTITFSHLISSIPAPSENATKTLVLAHREELILQAYNAVRKINPGLRVCIEQGSKHADVDADVIIGSAGTLGRANGTRLKKYEPNLFKLVIVDEAHHAVSATYRRIFDHFGIKTKNYRDEKEGHKAENPNNNKPSHVVLWGCSATMLRSDNLKLGDVFDENVYHLDMKEMMRQNWLVKFDVHSIKTGYSLDCNIKKSDFDLNSLGRQVNTESRNNLVVEKWAELCTQYGFSSTLVFGVNVEHVCALEKAFKEKGFVAKSVAGTSSRGDRHCALEEFKQGKLPVLINCGILVEGTDIPNIDCLVMARPTQSPVLYQQMLGRGSRLHPGKEICHVLDFVDNCTKHRPLSAPVLLGDEDEIKKNGPNEPAKTNFPTEQNYPDLSVYIQDTFHWKLFDKDSLTEALKRLGYKSKYSWTSIKISPKIVLYSIQPTSNSLIIFKKGADFGTHYLFDKKFHVLSKSKIEANSESTELAIADLESEFESWPNFKAHLMTKCKSWRSKLCSEMQVQYLKKLSEILSSKSKTTPISLPETDNLRRGQVANLICNIITRIILSSNDR